MEHEEFKKYEKKSYLNELNLGRFSPMPSERQRIIDEAKANGENPEAALAALDKKMEEATKKLREENEAERQRKSMADKTIKDLHKYMNRTGHEKP